jgi:hypothetical protein
MWKFVFGFKKEKMIKLHNILDVVNISIDSQTKH